MAAQIDSAPQPQFQRDTAALTNEVPVIAGDILRTIRTPAVLPSNSALANGSEFQIPKFQAVSPADNNHSTNTSTPAVRRLSTGEAFAAEVGIDLRSIGLAEARKIMSVEHRVLGFRPPHDSLAAAAQAAAARHPEGEVVEADSAAAGIFDGSAVSAITNGNGNGKIRRLSIGAQRLREAAREDAQRILSERTKRPPSPVTSTNLAAPTPATSSSTKTKPKTAAAEVAPDTEIDLRTLSIEDARTLISAEHRALGYRPPAGSLAAAAQRVAAKATAGSEVPTAVSEIGRDEAGNTENGNGTTKGAKHRRRSSASASTTSASISPTASPKARTRRFSNQARAPGLSPEKGRRSLSLEHGGSVNANARRGSSGSGSGSGDGGKEQKEREREEVLRAAALKDAERIRAQRDAGPRAQVVNVDQAPITEADVEVRAERLVKADVNNLAAQVQGHTQDVSSLPATSPSAYTAAAFPSSETRTPTEVRSFASSPPPGTTSAAHGQNTVKTLGDVDGESGEDIYDPLAAATSAYAIVNAVTNPHTNAKIASASDDDTPVEEGGYVEDVEDKENSACQDKPELVRTETEDSVQIIGDVLA